MVVPPAVVGRAGLVGAHAGRVPVGQADALRVAVQPAADLGLLAPGLHLDQGLGAAGVGLSDGTVLGRDQFGEAEQIGPDLLVQGGLR